MQSDLLRFDHTFGARIGIHPETFPRRIIGHGEGDHPLLEMQGSTGVLGCYRFIIHQNLTAGLNADGRHGTACVAHGEQIARLIMCGRLRRDCGRTAESCLGIFCLGFVDIAALHLTHLGAA